MKQGQPRQAVYRKDYTPYPWELDDVRLEFDIHASHTEVRAEMSFRARSGEPGRYASTAGFTRFPRAT